LINQTKTFETIMSFDVETKSTRTPKLDIEYLEWNPSGTRTMVLVHGWPDSARTWLSTAPAFAAAGFRVLAPSVRGYAGTRFLDQATPRSAQLSALGRDLLDFIDALGLHDPVLVGHDWGARAVANAAGLRSGVASHLVMVSVGYGTNTVQQQLSLELAQNYWYHWFMATPLGERSLRNDRRAFARRMWDLWSPPGWFDDAEFETTAQAFDNPDWVSITLHCYRHRWGLAEGDAGYASDDAALEPLPVLSAPMLVIHGAADAVNPPYTSAGKEAWFTGPYRRVLMEDVGHFPQRESPQRFAEEVLRFCG
jgi:pimeloyl-ACP methyl ester carboxylesterase